MNLGILLSRRFKITCPNSWHVSFVLAETLIFVFSIIGQILYLIQVETSLDISDTDKNVDIVLLLDTSSSLGNNDSDYASQRTKSVAKFVESLDDTYRLQTIAFAAIAFSDRTELLTMDNSGKEKIIQYVSQIDTVGKTDFDPPLLAA